MAARDPQQAVVPPLRVHTLAALRRRVLEVLGTHDECLQEMSEPHVHAVRLAARHLQPVLLVMRSLLPADRSLAAADKQVRRVLSGTTALREVHMYGLAVAALPGVVALKQALAKARERKERSLERRTGTALHKLDREALIRIAAQGWSGSTPAAYRRALQRAVAGRRSRLMRRIAEMRATEPDSLHRVRIALKRYRYLVDTFAPHLPAVQAAQRNRLKRLQARLGHWHDERVLADRLLSEAAQLSAGRQRICLALATGKAAWCAEEEQRLCRAVHRLRAAL